MVRDHCPGLDRYAGRKAKRVFIDLVERPGGERVAADVEVFNQGKRIAGGRTRDAKNDTNEMFGIALKGGDDHQLRIVGKDHEPLVRKFRPSGREDERIEVFIGVPRNGGLYLRSNQAVYCIK
jgi:hypothetical protein